jgi:tetratricopeptide (TPR) repeat protein
MDLTSVRESTAVALMNAEKLYRARRDFARAETLLKRAAELDPDNPKCYEKLGSLYNITGRLPEALVQMERMSKVDPANPYCYLNIGKLSTRLKQYDKAENAFRNAIKAAPNLSVGYRELARLYLTGSANLEKALELAKKAVDMEPSAENFFVLSWACDVNGDRPAALKAINEAIRLEPRNPKYRQIHERIKSGN